MQGQDFTRATLSYYPLIIVMKADTELADQQYESIFYFQFVFKRGSTPQLQLLKQNIVYNNQIFELSEAYGLKGEQSDECCVICLTNPKDTISKPCKHVSLCSSCAQVVFQSERKCPVCRQGITEIIPFQIVQTQQQQK